MVPHEDEKGARRRGKASRLHSTLPFLAVTVRLAAAQYLAQDLASSKQDSSWSVP